MLQRLMDKVIARADKVCQAWRLMRDGYRFGRSLVEDRPGECPLCHMASNLTNKPSE